MIDFSKSALVPKAAQGEPQFNFRFGDGFSK